MTLEHLLGFDLGFDKLFVLEIQLAHFDVRIRVGSIQLQGFLESTEGFAGVPKLASLERRQAELIIHLCVVVISRAPPLSGAQSKGDRALPRSQRG